MRQKQFNEIVSYFYRVDDKTLTVFVRELKEAKLFSSGARGVNAPHILPSDAAALTIALLSTDMPSQATKRVVRFAPIPFRPDLSSDDLPKFLQNLSPLNVLSALTAIFEDGPEDRMQLRFIEFHENVRKVRISHDSGDFWFRDQHVTQEQIGLDQSEFSGIQRIRLIPGGALIALQMLLNDRDAAGQNTIGLETSTGIVVSPTTTEP
jgi:hypothetical protein